MTRQPLSPLATLAVLLTLTAVSQSAIAPSQQAALAQSPAPTLPATVPEGTTVRINSSTSMAAISQALKQKFEAQYSGTKVELAAGTPDEALQALRDGKVDLAAIGRALTDAEKAEGLVQTPVARRKIAVVVGDKNPFPGDMTGEQFAQIFRGEITNWSQVGGADKPIRVIDRLGSDTRLALQSYPVFQSAPFQTGATAVPLEKENVGDMIRELGDDGISYAIVDQVADTGGVKIVTLYGTPPTDPSYPFSQALTYVYKQPANQAVQSFLSYAAAPESQQALAAVDIGETRGGIGSLFDIFRREDSPAASEASPDATPSPTSDPDAIIAPVNPPVATQAPASPADPGTVAQVPEASSTRSGLPGWLWLLSIPVLGALIWALLKGTDRPAEVVEAAPVAGVPAAEAVPVAGAAIAADRLEDSGRIVLVPRNGQAAYAYWEVPNVDKQRVRREEDGQQLALRLYDVTGQDFDRHSTHSIEQFDCDETAQDLHFPIPQSNREYLVELGYVTYQGRWVNLARSAPVYIPEDSSQTRSDESSSAGIGSPNLTAIEPDSSSASSSTSSLGLTAPPAFSRFDDAFRSQGTPLVDPSSFEQARSTELAPDRAATEVTATEPENNLAMGAALTGAAAGAGALTAAGRRVRRSRIVLAPRDSQDAYAYWEVLDHHKEIAKQHGGQNFILRICDVTDIDLENQAPHSIQQFNCEETDTDRHITVPHSGEYVAEIGYLAKNGRWLRIARSAPVSIPTVDSAALPPFS